MKIIKTVLEKCNPQQRLRHQSHKCLSEIWVYFSGRSKISQDAKILNRMSKTIIVKCNKIQVTRETSLWSYGSMALNKCIIIIIIITTISSLAAKTSVFPCLHA